MFCLYKITEVWIERLDGSSQSLVDFWDDGGLDLSLSSLSQYIWLEALSLRLEFLDYSISHDPDLLSFILIWESNGERMHYHDMLWGWELPCLEERLLLTNWEAILLRDDKARFATV